jgi:hypothetical protein
LRVGARYISIDQLLGLALNAFGHFIEDIGRLMHESTAALATGPYSSCRATQNPSEPLPMASFGAVESPRRFQLLKKVTPGLGAFPVTIDNG